MIEVIPVCTSQVLKVSQVSPEALDVQGLTVPKETEETLDMGASLDHKVNLHGGLFLYCLLSSRGVGSRHMIWTPVTNL